MIFRPSASVRGKRGGREREVKGIGEGEGRGVVGNRRVENGGRGEKNVHFRSLERGADISKYFGWGEVP